MGDYILISTELKLLIGVYSGITGVTAGNSKMSSSETSSKSISLGDGSDSSVYTSVRQGLEGA